MYILRLTIPLASVARYTVSQAIPHLVKLFLDPDEISNRPPVLILLTDLITAARESATTVDQPDIPLSPYKDEVLGVLTVGLKASSSRLPALMGLKAMVTTKELLSDDELGFIVHNVNEVLQTDPEEEGDDAK